MGKMTVKTKRGKVWRLMYAGTADEAHRIGNMFGKKPSTSNVVTLQPDHILAEKILSKFPNTMTDKEFDNWYDLQVAHDSAVLAELWKEREPETMGRFTLLPFQVTAKYFINTARRVILADERGVGKTVESCAAIEETDNNVLILAPPYLFSQWIDTIRGMGHTHKIIAASGNMSGSDKLIALSDRINSDEKVVYLVSYNLCLGKKILPLLLAKRWDYLICDEAHCLTNRKNAWSKAVFMLALASDKVVFASGCDFSTKFPNTSWALLNCIDPDRFHAYWDFYHYFIESYTDWYGPVPLKSKHVEDLALTMAPIRLRRTRDEIGFQMPPRVVNRIYVNLTPEHMEAYGKVAANRLKEPLTIPQGVALFGYLQRFVNAPVSLGYEPWREVTDTVFDLVSDIVQEGGKVLIFGIHKEYLRMLHKEFESFKIPSKDGSGSQELVKSMLLEGDIPPVVRDQMVQHFKADTSYGVLLSTIGAGGSGLNLPEIDNMIFVEEHWNPQVMGNAADRIYRLNSKKPVNEYHILPTNTVNEYIHVVANEKKEFIDEINSICRIVQRMGGRIRKESSDDSDRN